MLVAERLHTAACARLDDLTDKPVADRLSARLRDLPFPSRALKHFRTLNLLTIKDLVCIDPRLLKGVRNLGPKSIAVIDRVVDQLGFYVGMTERDIGRVNEFEPHDFRAIRLLRQYATGLVTESVVIDGLKSIYAQPAAEPA